MALLPEELIFSALLVSASEQFVSTMAGLMPASAYFPVCTARSATEARRELQERSSDLILVNTPLPDELGVRFAMDAGREHSSAILLLVKGELYDETNTRAMECGVFTLRKPTTAVLMTQSLDWLRAARQLRRGAERKAVSLEDKMAEIRLVNHAKWALIETCKMTEADAHRYIEKQAMDRSVTRREIAEGILRTYKNS